MATGMLTDFRRSCSFAAPASRRAIQSKVIMSIGPLELMILLVLVGGPVVVGIAILVMILRRK